MQCDPLQKQADDSTVSDIGILVFFAEEIGF
jgi:hypothetical protein